MTDMMRDMINELMGVQRAEEEGRDLVPYYHHSVCRAYLLDCCPHITLGDTRLESYIMCRLTHESAHRGEFLKAQEKKDHFYDVEAFEALEKAVNTVDAEVNKIKEKIKRDSEEQFDSAEFVKSQKVIDLNDKISSTLAKVEELGNEGKIEESLTLAKTVEELKKRKRELENEMRTNVPSQQRLRVCEACGAQLNILDHESRLADHYGGKMHLGMVEIRDKYNKMKETIDQRREAKRQNQANDRDKPRDRDRRRDYDSSRRDRRDRDRDDYRRDRDRDGDRRNDRNRNRSRSPHSRRDDRNRDRMEVRSRRPTTVTSSYAYTSEESFSYSPDGDDKSSAKYERTQLGFRHWLSIIAFVAVIYAGVVWQDKRMPTVLEPEDQYEHFSETRARVLLNQLAGLGPRVSGSEALEVHAFNLITNRLNDISSTVAEKKVNRLETDVQRPSGCFDLTFLSSFTLCYHKITNVIARIGPASGPSKHSILLNCHFDTLPDSPGATDDAVSCAIMMEILEVLAHSEEPLQNDIVFLFNGAEENFLQASHGFITSHPWKDSIRAFINLEGTGAGGREILFQAGPGNSWLLKTYLDNAPHPHCSVLAQEIFQSGIIPSDTDFRVFRDYGRVPGLDIAYTRNGWLYHTEFDLPEFINKGAIQRSGDNILAVVKALVKSLYLDQPGYFDEGNRWVFYDVVGLFTIFYTIEIGTILNYAVVFAVLLIVLFRISIQVYSFRDLLGAFYHHLLATLSMTVVGVVLVGIVHLSDLTMCWYSMPEIVFPLYIIPMIIAGCGTHSYVARTYTKRCAEMVHYDTVLILFAVILFMLTYSGVASAFFILIYVFFPCCRHFLIDLMIRFKYFKVASPRALMFTQMICFFPVAIFASYAVMMFFDFFVPVMGRMGNLVNPEWIMMPLSLLTAMTFVLFTSNLIYVSRRMDYLLKCSVALFLFGFVIIATTRVGVPYKWSEDNPRLRRIIALHTKRNMYDFYGNRTHSDNGLFIQAMDYRGIHDLPDHTFLQGTQAPDCSKTKDEYCSLPYYTAIHNLFPPEESRWVPLPGETPIPYPLKISLIERVQVSGNQVNLTFTVHGGYDKMSLHVTPLSKFSLKKWSFTELDIEEFGSRQTYFVFLTYGHERPEYRKFWILLESSSPVTHSLNEQASLELGVATHYAHGKYQNSETLTQLRQLINSRRKTPHVAVYWWKWAITHLGGTAEFVSGLY